MEYSGLLSFSKLKISNVPDAYISNYCFVFWQVKNVLINFDFKKTFLFVFILSNNYLFAFVFLVYFPVALRCFCPQCQLTPGLDVQIRESLNPLSLDLYLDRFSPIGISPSEYWTRRWNCLPAYSLRISQFHTDDLNALSVLEYAVEHLHVENSKEKITLFVSLTAPAYLFLIPCSCRRWTQPMWRRKSLINSPPVQPDNSAITRWLGPLTRLADYLGLAGKPIDVALPKLVEENVKMQVVNLGNTETIRKLPSGKKPKINGWVYQLETGLLKDLKISRV